MITPLSHALDASPWYVPLQIINSSSFRQSTFQTLVSVPFKLDDLLFRDNLVVFSRFSELKPLVSDDSKLNAFSVYHQELVAVLTGRLWKWSFHIPISSLGLLALICLFLVDFLLVILLIVFHAIPSFCFSCAFSMLTDFTV